MDTYTASVASTVAEVTVTPTTTDDGATIEYLDASNMTLTDNGHLGARPSGGAERGRQRHQGEGDGRGRQRHEDLHAVTVNRLTPTCTLNAGDIWCGVVTVGAIVNSFGDDHFAYGFDFKCREPVRHRVQCRNEQLHD